MGRKFNVVIALCFVVIILIICHEKSKESKCIVVEKRHVAAESGDGITSENERWFLFVKRIDTGIERVISTDRKSFLHLSVGDTLQKPH